MRIFLEELNVLFGKSANEIIDNMQPGESDDSLKDVMASLNVRDREYLNTLLNENVFGYDLSVEVECDQCGETFRGVLSAVNFLH